VQKLPLFAVVGVVAALAIVFWLTSTDAPPKPTGPGGSPAARPAPKGPVAFGIFPTTDDRFVSEPCNLVPGGGLSSAPAFMGEIQEHIPGAIAVLMGDLTLAEQGMGRQVSSYLASEVLPLTGGENVIVIAGEGELALSTPFLRDGLTRAAGVKFLCANAADAKGYPLMSAWVLLKSNAHGVLVVGVAADSLQAEIVRRGGDVRLLPAAEAVAKARDEAQAQARLTGVDIDVFALCVHGTVDETAALVEKTPGVTLAAAAHGPVLPEATPRKVGGVPILYGGRGMRFAWRALLPAQGGAFETSLARLGRNYLHKPSPTASVLEGLDEQSRREIFDTVLKTPGDRLLDPRGAYVGGGRCADCHIAIAAEHAASTHGKPSKRVLDGPRGATTGCINCHVTAPFSEGGWRGPKDRGDMAGVSCEACHGPGESHAAAPAKGWGKVDFARCTACHLPDRSPGFDPQAAWKRGGHQLVTR
jgi:hypothetical protein